MFVAVLFDTVNADKYKEFFQTREEAVNHVMNEWFAVNCSDEEKKNLSCWVEEKNGKLYNQTYNLYVYNREDELFEDYTNDKPKTIQELREYISQENHVTMFWADRAPCEYYIAEAEKELEKERLENREIEND